MMMKYKYLLFDADNTLFDFDAAELQAFKSLNDIYPGMFLQDYFSVYHEINDGIWKELEQGEIERAELKTERFRRYAERMNFEISDRDIERIGMEYPSRLKKGTRLIDGAAAVLDLLTKASYSAYIVTNGLSEVQRARVNASEIKKYVTNTYVSEEIGYSKPDKRFFEAVMNDIGDERHEQYLVIGDSLTSDIDGAAAAEIDACFFFSGWSKLRRTRRKVCDKKPRRTG